MKCNEKCCDDDVLFFKQKTAYEMRIGYWSSDVCSADLRSRAAALGGFSRAGRSAQDCVQPPRRPAGQGAAVLNADPLPIGERVGRGGSAFEAKPPPPRPRAGDVFHPDACGTTALVNSDRKSVVSGKRVSVRLDLGGRRYIKKKKVRIQNVELQ